MKTIIYATDCTVNDASSLRYAYRFSSMMNAELHILHVYQFPPITLSTIKSPETLRERFKKEQKERVAQYCATHLKNEFRKRTITIHVVESLSISKSILDLSKKLSPDLVIIGMKDSHTTRGYFSGSIGGSLLDSAEVPLLLVPNNITYSGISTIVYATDFEQDDIVSIKKLINIAKPYKAFLEIVHVYETDESPAKAQMETLKNAVLKDFSYPDIVFKTIASGKIKSGLLSVLNSEKASILAMLERKHDWDFSNLFHKDLVKEMEAVVGIPVLAFNKRHTKDQDNNTQNTNEIMTH